MKNGLCSVHVNFSIHSVVFYRSKDSVIANHDTLEMIGRDKE